MMKNKNKIPMFLLMIICWCGVSVFAQPIKILTSKAAFESDAYYFDKYFRERFNFKVVDNELMVRFKALQTKDQLQAFTEKFDVNVKHDLNHYYHHIHFSIAAGRDILQLCEQLNKELDILSAFPVLLGNDGYKKPVIGHELTVRFFNDLDHSTCLSVIHDMGSSVTEDHWTPGYYTVTVPEGMTLFQAIRAYNARSDVRYAEFSLISFDDMLFVPDDPQFIDQQNLNNTGQVTTCVCPPYAGHDIRAVDAWDITRGNPNVVVVIIDTGADLDHPDLVDNFLDRGDEDWNFADVSSNIPEDDNGHGTSCSGIAAGVTDNGLGISGIANHCRIMPLKVDLTSGQNQNRADAINYAASRRPEFDGMVLSNSWRMGSGSFTAVYDAIQNAKESGCVVAFAAGNDDTSPVNVPSDSEYCICVIALSPCDERKNTSSCDGENFWGSSYGAAADLSAPGVLIHTTDLSGGYTSTFNGTSSACPHVAGACALIFSLAPNISPDEVQSLLQNGCDDLGEPGWDQYTGYGRINLLNSLNLVNGVYLDKTAYMCSDIMSIMVRDQNAMEPVVVNVVSDTETEAEVVTLIETPGNPGEYTGEIVVSIQAPVNGDGIISVADGDMVTVTYAPLMESDTADIDCGVPEISDVMITAVTHNSVTITWTTNEPANSCVTYGETTPPDLQFTDDEYVTDHAVTVTGLAECADYVFSVSSYDPAGNGVTDNNMGDYYAFTTYAIYVLLDENMDADP
ncbi:S8 family serine peptidase, partial [bacterium]|nr:S8 family serine peptidase [candidate division CSSED10-310 bacterium]